MTSITQTGVGKLRPTKNAKRLIAEAMYARGKSFIGAAIILRRQEGDHEYVSLHLLCQGIELVLKGLLLIADYDAYQSRLQRDFGHHIERLAVEASQVYGLAPMKPALAAELAELSRFFSKHMLRYAGLQDIFIDPSSLERAKVLRRIAVVIRRTERALRQRSI